MATHIFRGIHAWTGTSYNSFLLEKITDAEYQMMGDPPVPVPVNAGEAISGDATNKEGECSTSYLKFLHDPSNQRFKVIRKAIRTFWNIYYDAIKEDVVRFGFNFYFYFRPDATGDIVFIKANDYVHPHSSSEYEDFNKDYYTDVLATVPRSGGSGWKNVDLPLSVLDPEHFLGFIMRESNDIDGDYEEGSVGCSTITVEIYYPQTEEEWAASAHIYVEVTVYIPEVTTDEATDIVVGDTTSFIMHGTITDTGNYASPKGFEYKKEEEGEITSVVSSSTDATNIIKALSGLENGTYYYRAWAENEAGKGYGEWVEIPREEITITTNAATEIGYDCAMGNGEITSGTNATERGFEIVLSFSGTLYDSIDHSIAGFEGDVNYSLDSDSWVGTLTKTETETGSFAEGEYSLVLGWETVLGNPGAVFSDKLFKCESYTYRAYAVIDGETYYGEYVAFSTLCDSGGEQQPSDDISDGDPTQPIIPEEEEPLPPYEPEEPEEIPYPPWEWDLPEWDIPDYPPPTFVGDFYYKKPYTKKDIDELRQKCIIYNKNSIEFALVLRHNINVLREFLNMMTDYLGTDEFNDFTDLVPPQNLKELYLDPIEPEGFRTIINGFINNTVNNNMAVNRNFKLIADGLSDYETSEDASFRDITSAIKRIDEDNPDVHRMKQIIDDLNYEVASNFGNVMYNLEVVRARLL